MTLENDHDLTGLKRIGAIVAQVLRQMIEHAEPGMTTQELDTFGRGLLDQAGAQSAPELCYKFPGATCISVNEEVAHGIPGSRVLQRGDVVNVDVSAELDGYFADTGGSFVVPPADPRFTHLCAATREALNNATASARAGKPFNHIGAAIERAAKLAGFNVIRNLCSHGVGRALHEDPEYIYPYVDPTDKRQLHEGQVITIEPFLSTRARQVREAGDGWTLVAPKGNRAAQYEHTMVITRGAPIVVTV